MKKTSLILIVLALLASCAPKERNAEMISKEISDTRTQISELSAKLISLEAELEAMEPAGNEAGIKVETLAAMPQSFETYVDISAVIEAVNEAMVSPESNGKILKIHVNEGDKVAKGQLLVSLDAEIMERSLEEMDKGLELTKTLFDKQKDLYDQGVGSEMQYLEIKNRYESMLKSRETLMTQVKMAKITAPFSGYVEKVYQKEGELASPGRQILHLVNLSELYIKTDLSENYLTAVHEKDTVWISFPHFPDMKKTARITQVGKIINSGSRTFNIRVDMKNEGEKLKPNMMADLRLRNYYNPEVLVLPTALIRQDIKGNFIFVARQHDGDTFAVKTYVQTGNSDGVHTEITGGLNAGDPVISNGFNQVRDGNKIMIVN